MNATPANIYGDRKPHEVPAYNLAEAARYLKMAVATLRSWVVGRNYPREDGVAFFEPLIKLPDINQTQVSFANLVEAHVLRALRTEHGVPVRAVRSAIGYAETELGVKHLLLNHKLRTDARELFLAEYGKLINLSRSGQYAIERVLKAHLERVEWRLDVPLRLYPFLGSEEAEGKKAIAIDPAISFGRPIVASKGVSTAAIVDRIDAGESPDDVAADYGLDMEEVTAAIVYERAA